MAMSQQEYIRRLQDAGNKFVSRNKTVDSSLLTMTRQFQGAKNQIPASVATKQEVRNCAMSGVARGKGTSDSDAVLAAAVACGVCPTVAPADTGLVTHIILPTPCINYSVQPFAQINISTIYPAPQVPSACATPGNFHYFPVKPQRGDTGLQFVSNNPPKYTTSAVTQSHMPPPS